MARGFGSTHGIGATDKITTAYTTGPTQQTIACSAYRAGGGGGDFGRLLCQQRDGTSATNELTWNSTNYHFRRGAGGLWSFNANNLNQWYKFAVSYDRSSTANDPIVYVDGSSVSITEVGAPTSFTDGGQAWLIGNREDSTRQWDGYIAECAIWNVILDAAEMAAASSGISPLLIRPASLVEYVPLVRDVISRKLGAPTVTGTAVQPHTRIIMPLSGLVVPSPPTSLIFAPDADVTDDGWTDQDGGSSLFEAIDETSASDSDYIKSPLLAVGDPARTARVSLSNPTGLLGQPLSVRYRYGAFGSTPSLNLVVRLCEGDLLIAEWQHESIAPGSILQANQTLTSEQFASIVDFADLFLEFEAWPSGDPLEMFGADLVAWYDANEGVYNDAGSTLATNGQTVRQWNDLSGNDYHASQATSGNRPTLNTTGFNGLPGIEFTDATDFMLTATDAVALGGTVIAGFAVIKFGSGNDSANNRIWSFFANGATHDFDNVGSCSFHTADSGLVVAGSRNNAFWLSQLSFTASTNYRFGGIWDGTNFTTYKDNVAGTPAASAPGSFGSTGTICIAANPGEGASSGLDGTIAELVIVKRALNSSERNALDAYFTNKWGL